MTTSHRQTLNRHQDSCPSRAYDPRVQSFMGLNSLDFHNLVADLHTATNIASETVKYI